MSAGIITIVSVAVNALVTALAPFIARKLARQRDELRRAEETCALLSDGITTIERAVEENKDALSRTGAGDRIARTIRAYGAAAKQLVDAARMAARRLRENGESAELKGE